MNRVANCLARAGDQEGATTMRDRAATLEALMDDKVHDRLRIVLGQLDNPEVLIEVVDFYRKIGRPEEAEAWSGYIEFLGRQTGDADGAVDAPPPRG